MTSIADVTNPNETEGEGYADWYADFALSLPSWLPQFVANEVEAIYEVILEGRRLDEESFARRRRRLNCLAADERMKRVWDQLLKRRRYKYRPTDEFLHPVSVDGLAQLCREVPTLTDAKTRQEFALRVLLWNAFWLEEWTPHVIPKAKIDAERESYLMAAASLRKEAKNLRSIGMESADALTLEAIALRCEENANRFTRAPLFYPVVKRLSQGDQGLRGYVMRLAAVTKILFGTVLYSTVANIAGAVCSTKVSAQQVHDLLRTS